MRYNFANAPLLLFSCKMHRQENKPEIFKVKKKINKNKNEINTCHYF